MERGKKKDRIYVRPNDLGIYLAMLMTVLLLSRAVSEQFWIMSIFLGLIALFLAASQFGRTLIAGPGGIVIHKLWGRTVRFRYSDLTKVEVCFWGRRTIMNFYKGGERIGRCESTDENFEKLLSSLLEIMPERVIFNRQGL